MTIGIVAFNAFAEPENFLNAKIIAEASLDFDATQIGIAILIQ